MTRTLLRLFALTPRLALAVVLAAVLGASAVACSGGRSDADEGKDPAGSAEDGETTEEAVPVEVEPLARGPIEAVLRFTTNLEAEEQVAVFSQAARQVRGLHVEEGDRVRKGQTLVRLEDAEQRTRLAKVKSQLDRARKEYDRQQRLFANELISEQAFNDATYELSQLELELEDAQRELSYTNVVAPISGTITRRLVNLGDQVTVNQHLFDLVDFDSIVARVYVPERQLGRLAVGQPARVTAPALGGRSWQGLVDRLSPVVDPRSGTVKVTVAIPRQEELRPGMYVDVALVTDVHEDALLVPKRALVYDGEQTFVYRMEDGTAERVYIAPLLEDERHVEPVGDLLSAGDRVVVAGQAGLKQGAKIRLAGEEPEPAAGEAEETESRRGRRARR